MNAELTRNRTWMLTGLCATVVLCCAGIQSAFAQDFDAVGRRLREAVAAGELTGAQARAMLGALRKSSESTQEKQEQRPNMEVAVKRVRAAIEAGDMTPEQGRARLQAMRQRMAEGGREAPARGAAHRDLKSRYAAAEKEIQAAVKAGKIAPERGRARLRAIRDRLATGATEPKERAAKPRAPKDVYAAAEKEIKAAIKTGRITETQGKERLAGLRRRLAAGAQAGEGRGARGAEGRDSQARYAAAEKEIKAAVKSGRITETQGQEKLVALRKRLAAGARGQRTREENTRVERTRQRDPKAAYRAAEREIKAAIKAGKITEAQGRERLAGLKRRLAAGARDAQARQSEQGQEGERQTRGEGARRR